MAPAKIGTGHFADQSEVRQEKGSKVSRFPSFYSFTQQKEEKQKVINEAMDEESKPSATLRLKRLEETAILPQPDFKLSVYPHHPDYMPLVSVSGLHQRFAITNITAAQVVENQADINVFLKRENKFDYTCEVLMADRTTRQFTTSLYEGLAQPTKKSSKLALRLHETRRGGGGSGNSSRLLPKWKGRKRAGRQAKGVEKKKSRRDQPLGTPTQPLRFWHSVWQLADHGELRGKETPKIWPVQAICSSKQFQYNSYCCHSENPRGGKKLKKAKKSGVDVSSSSSSSSSSSDVEVHEVGAASSKNLHQQTKSVTSSSATTTKQQQQMLDQQRSAGPYIPANESQDGRKIPQVDPKDASLSGTLSKLNPKSTANVKMVDESMLVRENAPVPHSIKESSPPHTTVHTWHESTAQPETVTTEVDGDGNIIRRTVIKSEQVRHTVQTQSYQTYAIGDEDENTAPPFSPTNIVSESRVVPGQQQSTKSPPPAPPPRASPAVESIPALSPTKMASTKSRWPSKTATMAMEWMANSGCRFSVNQGSDTGNRTVETLTYKKEKDGVIETHVEHRITIHSGDEIDHDAELSRAILEATNMNPEMTVEKIVSSENH
uniref:Band 4.1 C-terminal domain-containing protein n=1 Tax=Ditylenchus dipsaci TaxID=166011 RepID=A0A915EK24_9BILA